MKILYTGWVDYLNDTVFYSSGLKKLVKYNLTKNIQNEFVWHLEFDKIQKIKSNNFLISCNLHTIEINQELERIGLFNFGRNLKSFKNNNIIFSSSTLLMPNQEYKYYNWLIDGISGDIKLMPFSEDIKFYEFHNEYFIPVTYMNANQGHSYGPELSVYNYQGELVWSKDFRELDTYIDSEPVFHNEFSVNSNVKICDDYLVVCTSTNHLFCYDIHTGKQIWSQCKFEGPFPNPQMVALDTEQKIIYVWLYMTFHKIDLLTGQIILSKDMWEWHDRFRHRYVSWTVAKDGLWSATESHGVVACINKETLDIDQTYQLESHGTINLSAAPHVTDEFVVIPDGLGNLEVIKR